MKVKNRLLDTDLIIYQDDDWFKFSLDSVLLSSFVTLNLRVKNILDLATGNAPIPMLLTYRTKAHIYGVEYQECIFQLGKKSILVNQLEDRITLLNDDVRLLKEKFSSDFFDVIVCNPPYFKVNYDFCYLNDNKVKAIARHELMLSLDDVLKQASYLLKNGGIFAMVHRTERLVEILNCFTKYHIEPKRIQFIYPKEDKESNLFLIEGIKNGRSGLKMLSPLIIHKSNNDYTEDVEKILKFDYRGEI